MSEWNRKIEVEQEHMAERLSRSLWRGEGVKATSLEIELALLHAGLRLVEAKP